MPPVTISPPSLRPLDHSVPCLAVRGQSLREGNDLELHEWSSEEQTIWGIPPEVAVDLLEVRMSAPEEELPRLIRIRRK